MAAAIFRTSVLRSVIWLCLMLLTEVPIAVCQDNVSDRFANQNSAGIPGEVDTTQSIHCRLRFSWGGGAAKRWSGFIRLTGAELNKPAILGFSDESSSSLSIERRQVSIRQRFVSTFEGVDVDVYGNNDSIVNVELSDEGSNEPIVREFLLSQLLADGQVFAVDQQGNRMSIARAPGDTLQFKTNREHLVFDPGESFSFEFRTYQNKSEQVTGNCVLELSRARSNEAPLSSTNFPVDFSELSSTGFVQHSINVPNQEGVFNLRLKIRQRSSVSLRANELERVREVQFVVVDRNKNSKVHHDFNELVAEIDPAKLRTAMPYQLSQLSKMIGLRSNHQPLGTYEVAPDENTVQLQLGGWQAIPLTINGIGKPHTIEIDYPAGEPMSIGFSVLQPDETGQIPNFGFDSGIDVSRSIVDQESRIDGTIETHRFVFWPGSKQVYLLIANRSQAHACKYQSIRVFADSGQPADILNSNSAIGEKAKSNPNGGTRKMMSFYEQPLFAENFSVNDDLDAGIGQPISDWVTFYEGINRLAQYLKDSGSGGAIINVFGEGSALLPLSSFNPSPRYDSGVFSSFGHDPIRKDVVELIYRIFEREGLQFIPAVTFNQRLADIEFPEDGQIDNAALVIDYRQEIRRPTESSVVPVYNPLCPDVQALVTKLVSEIADRYRERDSYRGLAIVCRPDTFTLLPGGNIAGYDDGTIARFARETFNGTSANKISKASNPSTPVVDHSRIKPNAVNVLSAETYPTWLQWRADQMSNWYRELEHHVTGQSNRGQLFLAMVDIFRNEEIAGILAPSLHRKTEISNAMKRLGVQREIGSESLVLMQPTRLAPILSLASQKSEFSVQASQKLDQWFADQQYPASLFSHRSSWARFENLEGSHFLENQSAPILRLQQLNPAGAWNRERFAKALLNTDSRLLVDGGLLLSTTLDNELKQFAEIFSALPDARFTNVKHGSHPDEVHPLAVRYLRNANGTYLYCVNGSPWSVSATVESSGQLIRDWNVLGNAENSGQVNVNVAGQLQLELEPFELLAVKFNSSGLRFERYSYQLPQHAQRDLNTSYYKLRSHLIASGNAKPVASLQDPSFESNRLGNGWTVGNQQADFLQFEQHDSLHGSSSLLIHNANDQSVWIRSNRFSPPETGRLSISVWLKTEDERQQPPLRISVESSDPESNYYRFAELGSQVSDRQQHQLTTSWKRFAVHFDDLPQEKLTGLRVGFDMIGPGQVWIDQVELFDRWMDENDLKAMTQMFASVGSLIRQPEKLERCRQILTGYWPVFLREYFDENLNDELNGDTNQIVNEGQQQPTIRSSMRRRFRRFVSPGIFQFR